MLAVPNQISATYASQSLTQHGPIVGIVIAQESLVQPPYFEPFWNLHRFAGLSQALQRILAAVIHGGRGCHGAGQEGLHLVRAITILLQPQSELEHVRIRSPRVRRDEIRNEVLLLARLFRIAIE